METWKAIEGAGGYEVSDCGHVRSTARVVRKRSRWGGEVDHYLEGRTLVGVPDKNGYLCCALGRGRFRKIHRLVAAAFVARSLDPSAVTVNHKNGIKSDNRADNLEWCSNADNQRHYRTVLGNGQRFPDDKRAQLRQMRQAGLKQRELAAVFGISRALVSIVLSGRA